MSSVIDVISWAFLLTGSFFVFTGAVGLLRLPEFFTRMHGVGVTDTLGAGLMLSGMLLQSGSWVVAAKLILIFLFMMITGPTATHALAKAALHGGLKPRARQDGKRSVSHRAVHQ
ncbi:MAG TPA: monovalent cation/H(+) antiporter subunit G [Gammaproteobacteria bacterium]|nr:monovalent cation/H(+) antiporter subunit G [Gammaproteobacteria bacterium]